MKNNTAKVHEVVSRVTITDNARPEIVQHLLSWIKDTVTTIVQKKKF